jgi:hypothetical protein
MKRKMFFLACGVTSVFLVGCGVQPTGEVTAEEIKPTLLEYYDAFNSYDSGRIEAVFARAAWQENISETKNWLYVAKDLGLQSDFVSVDSVKVEEDSVWVTIGVNSSFGAGQDVFCLVREGDGWKIARLVTRKTGLLMPIEEPLPASSCCPTGSSCN